MAVRYRGRLIKADPDDLRPCWVYSINAPGFPNLYIGISARPNRRLRQHQKRFRFAPQPLSMEILRGPMSRFEARKVEIDLHIEYPHAVDWHTVKAHVDSRNIAERERHRSIPARTRRRVRNRYMMRVRADRRKSERRLEVFVIAALLIILGIIAVADALGG